LKTSLSVLAFIIGFACISQNERQVNSAVIDSILKATAKIPTADEKVTYLSRATSKLRYGGGSLALIKKSEEISKKANVPKLLATTYYYYSNYYYYNTNLDSSLFYIKKSKDFISDEELPFLRSSILNTEGGVYVLKGDMPKALSLTLKSQEFLDKVDTTSLVGDEKIIYKKERLALDNSIANFYNQMEEYEKATYYYDKGYRAALRDSSFIAAGVFMTNKGDLYLNTEKYEKALEAFLEGKKLKEKGKSPPLLLVNSDLNIGIAYTNLNNFEEGLPYLNTVISFYESSNISGKLAESLAYRGDHFLKQEKYNLAIADCEKAKEITSSTENLQVFSKACECLYSAYKATDNYKEAIANYELYVDARETIFNEKNIKKQTQQEMEFEFNKTSALKNAEIIAREKESRLYSILSIIGFLFAAFLGFFFYKNRKKNLSLAKQKKLLEATIDEKNVLLKETHHRVKNSFQIVSSLLYLQSENMVGKEAQIALREAQNRVRSMVLIHQRLYNKDQLVGIDSKEYLEALTKDIFETHQFKKEKLPYVLNIEPIVLSIETITPIGLILNELIINVLKHAFEDITSESLLSIDFEKKDDTLVLKVIDNGKGFNGEIKETSFGIKLMNTLAKKLRATLNYKSSENNGTEVVLNIKKFEIL
jgi:two-component sensor histidine kinase|tara:strand:+ start:223 stop:2175 length:1953 start_codon:yes stop_codon:yes gene_type:complete